MKKIEEKIIIILAIIFIIGITLAVVKFEIQKKFDYNKLANNTLCNRKKFSKQLEYIANEQAVFYNLDDENVYKDKIDTNQNKFKEHMEATGWKYEVYPESDFAYQNIIFEFTKNGVKIYLTIEKENKKQKYYDFNTFYLIGRDQIYPGYTRKEPHYIDRQGDLEILNNIADNLDEFHLDYENNVKEEVDLAEQIFKEFIKDVQSYTQETCSNAVES